MALALVRTNHINTLVLTYTIRLTALVHIDTTAVVTSVDDEPVRATALYATVHHVAGMFTTSIRKGAQVVSFAVEPVLLQGMASGATAFEATVVIVTLVRTAAIVKVTLVDVSAQLMISRGQLIPNGTYTAIASL